MATNPEKPTPVPEEAETKETRENEPWDVGFATEKGTDKAVNQDSYLADREHGIFLVADGMGGHSKGEQASQLACDAFARIFKEVSGGSLGEHDLQEIVAAVAAEVVEKFRREPGNPGSTLSGIVESNGEYWLIHVGDSRVYRWREGKLVQLTRDHTWAEVRGLKPGHPNYRRASNMVVAAIGCGKKISPVDVDVSKLDRQPGDLYIVASDGICKTADIDSNELISKVLEMLTSRGTDSEQIASQLLQYVKHAVPHDKRRDDITIGVLQDKK